MLRLAWEGTPANLSGATVPSVGVGAALAYEFVMTAFRSVRGHGGRNRHASHRSDCLVIAIGGTVALDALFGGGVTGASMKNPSAVNRSVRCCVVAESDGFLDRSPQRPLPRRSSCGAFLYSLVRDGRGPTDE